MFPREEKNDLGDSYVFEELPEYISSSPQLGIEEILYYSSGEYLAHTFAYSSDIIDNSFVKIDDVNHYQLKKVMLSVQGLVCYILTPLLPHYSDAHVIFRGTKCFGSVVRDLEVSAPGHDSFKSMSELMMQQISHAVVSSEKEVTVNIYGHSLGGADAQHCFTDLMDKIDQANLSVKKLRLLVYSSAGVNQEVADRAANLAKKLKEKSVKIECFWMHAAGDAVQTTGAASILCNVDADIATVHLLKVRAHEKIDLQSLDWWDWYQIFNPFRPITAHTKKHFTPEQDQFLMKNFEYYNNSTIEGQCAIAVMLNNKSSFLQAKFVTTPQAMLGSLLGYFVKQNEINSVEQKQELSTIKNSATLLSMLRAMAACDAPASAPVNQTDVNLEMLDDIHTKLTEKISIFKCLIRDIFESSKALVALSKESKTEETVESFTQKKSKIIFFVEQLEEKHENLRAFCGTIFPELDQLIKPVKEFLQQNPAIYVKEKCIYVMNLTEHFVNLIKREQQKNRENEFDKIKKIIGLDLKNKKYQLILTCIKIAITHPDYIQWWKKQAKKGWFTQEIFCEGYTITCPERIAEIYSVLKNINLPGVNYKECLIKVLKLADDHIKNPKHHKKLVNKTTEEIFTAHPLECFYLGMKKFSLTSILDLLQLLTHQKTILKTILLLGKQAHQHFQASAGIEAVVDFSDECDHKEDSHNQIKLKK